jgi:hypothetical protein
MARNAYQDVLNAVHDALESAGGEMPYAALLASLQAVGIVVTSDHLRKLRREASIEPYLVTEPGSAPQLHFRVV